MKRVAAHLNFSDRSPLKEFAFCLRSKQNVYIRNSLSANVNASNEGHIGVCIQTHARACPANLLSAFVYANEAFVDKIWKGINTHEKTEDDQSCQFPCD